MEKKYILALDQGTTSSRTIVFDKKSRIIGMSQEKFPQIYPRSGWVEHDPEQIWQSQLNTIYEVLSSSDIKPEEIASIGITNQRETTIVWEKESGRPVHHAIVWQCRRTAEICDCLKKRGLEDYVKKTTGLLIDAYFSATKIRWILDHIPNGQSRAENGELLFGTVDTWLLWKLSGGKCHATDYSNASRTMLFNINQLTWDDKLLKELNIPLVMMPSVKPSSHIYGYTDFNIFREIQIPISGIAGDQQSALFGQACFNAGDIKNTYGTGCFLLMNTGDKKCDSKNGLLTTIAWGIQDKIVYALEGSVFMAGAAVGWLKDELHLIENESESDLLAASVEDTHGVYFVPAFAGLGAPYWDMYARGAILGLSRGSNRRHIVRATLESIAYQTRDVIDAMIEDANMPLSVLKVDGGVTKNQFLMQFQSDILNKSVYLPTVSETTALGAAYLAGLAVGFWSGEEEISENWKISKVYEPAMMDNVRQEKYDKWKFAVQKSMGWENQNV
ncbi:MAG: glycerol kinase GlpK [Tissierellales bacterium]|nr:glycerol kinase GlpK [Tissierellales bacterium]MBN2827367.1 glycerol kinase GlpK [Tissierellales bacterium]